MLLIVFTVSMFASASLLFLVEPMIAKMLLPMLGGTPAVWNTCMVFFQVMLLAGYFYAYATLKCLGRRMQIVFHASLVMVPLLVHSLPLHLPTGWEPPTQRSPVFCAVSHQLHLRICEAAGDLARVADTAAAVSDSGGASAGGLADETAACGDAVAVSFGAVWCSDDVPWRTGAEQAGGGSADGVLSLDLGGRGDWRRL
jgi:hypothetical protein